MSSITGKYLPPLAEADSLAAAAAKLEQAAEVLSPAGLSELLQKHVSITHARMKPGHSVVVAHSDLAEGAHAWTMLTNDPDKFSKAQLRAQGCDQELEVHQNTGERFLYSGSVWADPALSKELAAARTALDEQEGREVNWQILRFNPRRRVVAVVDAGHHPKVVRVVAPGTDLKLETARRWRQLGLPVTNVSALGQRGTASIAPLWGAGDLSTHPYAPAARTAGAAVAQLHSTGRAEACGDRPHADPKQAAAALVRIAPWLAEPAHRVAEQTAARLQRSLDSAAAEIHGDLSPDQIILAAETSHKIRIIDLDRAGCGHPMRDLGSWAAACRRDDRPELLESFLSGYQEHADISADDLNAWEAYAHLSSATEFYRHRQPDWPQLTLRALERAEEALNR
ncbi:phosphotransferase [Nesterenkonia sp. MY13]|uniref:Phosphotransferase n=1 Tax=Nesterenkonia sedimenti TaxID=1463632 RepID=A0A7X8TMA9_9MICC|nr:phosphotransferase [Nesterenkonia sedimenti]NLS11161.1 phosphotransferase [Nesterenkonia sedimenti]